MGEISVETLAEEMYQMVAECAGKKNLKALDLTKAMMAKHGEGGLMLLAHSIIWQGRKYRMAGILPFEVAVCAEPQGHSYTELSVDAPNPSFPQGLTLKGHEFHYSRILPGTDLPNTACAVRRGVGAYHGRDGVIVGNLWASYTHLHALATPEWARGLLNAARPFAGTRVAPLLVGGEG